MSNNLGLFHWIRDGVRQSVLLGVSDALESIGTPDNSGKLHPALMSFSQNNIGQTTAAAPTEVEGTARKLGSTTSARKRLGRSLKDIEPNKPAT